MKKKLFFAIFAPVCASCCIFPLVACGEADGSPTLSYELNSDGESYAVVGAEFHGENGDVVVPSQYRNKPVTRIAVTAFSGWANLTSIVIPDSITVIDDGAFRIATGLKNVIIGDGVTAIGDKTFSSCVVLEIIAFSNSVKSIGADAFYACEKLADISFAGTIVEWNAIVKADDWDSHTGNYTIRCTDGDIAKN